MSGALSRAAIAAMAPAEYRLRRDEIRRWVAAGGEEDKPAPPSQIKRPENHQFTLAEVKGMSQAEHVANLAAIKQQIASGALKGQRRAKSSS